jgi:murein DD-endopeptidase MepM/ murein hydrolase activator NlpD
MPATAVIPSVERTVQPVSVSDHRFPVQGLYNFGGAGARFGAPRTGHRHQGQDIMAAEGTPVVAPTAGVITWRSYQAEGAGYYLVLHASTEPYDYVFMHLQRGSLLVSKGDSVSMGEQIARVGHTGVAEGPHLHFEAWDGPWYNGGHAIDPLPMLRSWATVPAAARSSR